MSPAEIPQYLWGCLDGVLNEERPDDWKFSKIYHHLSEPEDPPMPADFSKSPDYSSHVAAMLKSTRDRRPDLLTLMETLKDVIRAWSHRTSSPHSGQKRSRAVVEDDLEDGVANRSSFSQVDEIIGALASESSERVPLFPFTHQCFEDNPADQAEDSEDDDLSKAPSHHQIKRARIDSEPNAYQDLNSILGTPALEALMDAIEDGLTKFIKNQSGALPSWDPTAKWEEYPDILAHLKNLKIPCIPLSSDAMPDMLLASLGSGDQVKSLDDTLHQRWLHLVKPFLTSWYLVNASGSGKTRLLFEILVRHWSFYLTCGHDDVRTPYGSMDITRALEFISSSANQHHTDKLGVFNAELKAKIDEAPSNTVDDIISQRNTNSAIATHVFRATVLARCLIFESFLICWQRRENPGSARLPGRYLPSARQALLEKYFDGTRKFDQPAAIRVWAFIQICPQLVLQTTSSGDMFSRLLSLVQWVNPDAIDDTIGDMMLHWSDSAKVKFQIVMFDEVQTLAGRWRWAFGPEDPGNQSQDDSIARDLAGKPRPVLKPLLVAVTSSMPHGSKTLIAATKFNESTIDAAIGSGVAKLLGKLKRFIDFGDQGTPAEIAGTLTHYFGPGISKLINHELWSEIKYWLIGRHRYLMVFIQFVLHLGPKSMDNVLKNMIWRLTKYRPPGLVEIPEMDLGPVLSHDARLRGKVQKNPHLYHSIQRIAYAWIFNNQFPLLPQSRIELVTLGIGRLVPGPDKITGDTQATIQSTENLTASALYCWLNGDERDTSLSSMLNDDLSSVEPTTRGYALENALVYLFWDKFSAGCPLEDVFDFVYLPPSWRGRRAHLVDVCANFNEAGVPWLHERGLAGCLAWNCSKIAQTAAWFRKGGLPSMRIPFLRPDNLAGPDIFFILRLDTGEEILICVQSKAWSAKHRNREVLEEIFKLSPERFYGSKSIPTDKGARKIIAKRKSRIQALLTSMLLPSKLDMSPPPNTVFVGNSAYPYDRVAPKYPLLRVFAAYEGSYKLEDTTPGKMGRYPLAILSEKFLKDARDRFPSMDEAAKALEAYKAQIQQEELLKWQQEAEEQEMCAAWSDYEDDLEVLVARAAGIDPSRDS